MRDFLAITGFLLLQFGLLALIGVWQEHKKRKNRMERAIGEQWTAIRPEASRHGRR